MQGGLIFNWPNDYLSVTMFWPNDRQYMQSMKVLMLNEERVFFHSVSIPPVLYHSHLCAQLLTESLSYVANGPRVTLTSPPSEVEPSVILRIDKGYLVVGDPISNP